MYEAGIIMTVRQIMSSNVVYLTPEDNAVRAAKLFERHNFGMIPVCTKEGKLRGVVTDRDITLRCVAFGNTPEETPLRDIMTRGIITVSPDDSVTKAAKLMSDEKIRCLPVIEGGKTVGIISISDLVKDKNLFSEVSSALFEISASKRKFRQK